jgi:2-isopropylmalate synthase
VFNFEKDGISQKKSIETMKGPIEAALLLSQEIGLPVKLNSYKQSVVSNADEESAGKAFSEITLSANEKSAIGRGISSSTLIANMRALFGGINKLYRD